MLGLPAHPGRVGIALIVAGILVAAVLAPLVWASLRRSLPGPEGRWPALLLAASLLCTLAAAPFLAWRIVEDIHYTDPLTGPQAERIGGDMRQIDYHSVDGVAAVIPPGQTFYVAADPGMDPLRRREIEYWAGYALLPRIRVRDPARARWIVGWETDPRLTGLRVGQVIRVSPVGDGDVVRVGRVES